MLCNFQGTRESLHHNQRDKFNPKMIPTFIFRNFNCMKNATKFNQQRVNQGSGSANAKIKCLEFNMNIPPHPVESGEQQKTPSILHFIQLGGIPHDLFGKWGSGRTNRDFKRNENHKIKQVMLISKRRLGTRHFNLGPKIKLQIEENEADFPLNLSTFRILHIGFTNKIHAT